MKLSQVFQRHCREKKSFTHRTLMYIEFCGFTRICQFLQQRAAATINITTCGWKQLTVKGKPKICTLKFYITQKLFQCGSLNDSVLSQYKWEFQLFVKCDLSIFKVKQFGVVWRQGQWQMTRRPSFNLSLSKN